MHYKTLPILFCMFFITNCATGPTKYQVEWDSAKEEILSQLIDSHCPATPPQKECGLISRNLYNVEFPKLLSSVCKPQKLSKDACATKFTDMVLARYKMRYQYADWTAANLWCNANPTICDFSRKEGAELFEQQLVLTHNRNVGLIAQNKFDEIQLKASKAEQERMRAWQNAWNPPKVRCTSSNVGDTTYTDCQ